jgi:iron complex outermembrane receptor protein
LVYYTLRRARIGHVRIVLRLRPGTLDYFRIDVEGRIVIGPYYFLSEGDVAELIALGVPGASDFTLIRFFGNNLGTRAEGFDAVLSYTFEWPAAGQSQLQIGWNHTRITPFDLDGPNRSFTVSEQNQPRNRANLTIEHAWQDFRLLGRLSYYDSYTIADTEDGPPVPICTDERPKPDGADQCYGAGWIFDIELAYTFADRYTAVVGAENVLDQYPDRAYDTYYGQVYTETSPFGYNGGFWYLRLRADF